MAVRPPSLRAIAAFEAAARHESFAKAAEELNLSHSAISHAIRGLEERLRSRLFERRGRAVVLTPGGRSLAERLRLSLSLLADAFDDQPQSGRQRLVIGAPTVVAERMLASRVRAFRLLHPDVQVELRCDVASEQVASGDIDVEIQYGAERPSSLTSRLLAHETLLPVARADLRGGHRLGRPVDLLDWPLIHSLEHPWAFWFAQHGVTHAPLDSAVIVDGAGVAIEAAKRGLGVCLARSFLVAPDLEQGGLVRLLDVEAASGCAYRAAWNPRSQRGGLVQAFVDWLSLDLARPAGEASNDRQLPVQDAA